jgi:hypothetical protein
MKRLFFIGCMLLVSMSFAKKWDATYISKLIASGGIDKVIEYYKGRYFGDNRDPQDAFRIAELYVKKKEYATAMEWYDKESQLINTSKVNLFNYANTNRLMGEYQKALDGYLMYAAMTGDVNKVMDLANQCEKILKSSALSYNYKLENYPYNTSSDETNVAVLRTNPVYVTIKNQDNKDGLPTYDIYQIVRAFQGFDVPVRAYNKGIPKLMITAVSFSQDGNTVVFSAIEEKTSSKKGKPKNEKIYIADNLGGNFLNVKPFTYNAEGYSLKNPAFNTEGNKIYFSSNQPGGFGGFDIWESSWENQKWSTPKNLGKLLNSTANEINPFMMQDGKNNTLYFSSDRDGGFGGYDIFSSKKINTIWQDVVLQTAPINSAGDDISVVFDVETKTGYFSSNRTGGKGGFDVYRFTPFSLKLMVYANDTFSEKPIDYALVQIFDNNEKLFEGMTDQTGKAEFQINKDKIYTLKTSKDGYRTFTQKVSAAGKTNGDSVVGYSLLKPDAQFSISKGATNNLSLDNYIIFTGKVTDAATGKPATKAKMRMVNYTTQKLREVDIDATGKFEIKLLLNNNYKVIFETQEQKITDELTTYGLEKNSIKVRDYLLTGNKFKLTENKVYKEGNLPPNRIINFEIKKTTSVNATNEYHEPITQQKIDSLLKVIASENSKEAQPKINVSKSAAVVTATAVPEVTPSSVIIPDKKEPEILTASNKSVRTNSIADTLKTEEKIQLPLETENKPAVLENKIQATKESAEQKKPVTIKTESAPQFAADMVNTKKPKKIKFTADETEVIPTDSIQEKSVVETTKIENIPTPVIETPIAIVAPKIEHLQNKTENISKDATKLTDIPTIKTEIKEEAVVAESKAETVTEILPDVYYKIQLASYDVGNLKFPEFETLGKMEEVRAYERYIYRLGNFDNLERAKEILELVRSQGYFVAFILQYNKEKVTGIVK